MTDYFGSSSDSGASVYAGNSGRVRFADDRYVDAYVVKDGKGDSELYAHVGDSAGHVLRTIEVKEDSDLNYDPAVGALGNGSFVVAWTNSDDDDAATDTHVLARVYSNDGARSSSLLAVSGNGKQHADEASVVGLSAKRFVIAYENDTTHTVHAAVYTQTATGGWSSHDEVIDSSVGANGGNPTVSRVSATSFRIGYTDADGHQVVYQESVGTGGLALPGYDGGSHLTGGLLGSIGSADHGLLGF